MLLFLLSCEPYNLIRSAFFVELLSVFVLSHVFLCENQWQVYVLMFLMDKLLTLVLLVPAWAFGYRCSIVALFRSR